MRSEFAVHVNLFYRIVSYRLLTKFRANRTNLRGVIAKNVNMVRHIEFGVRDSWFAVTDLVYQSYCPSEGRTQRPEI